MICFRRVAFAGMCLIGGIGAARATVFCADTAAEVVADLAIAQANGSDDEVRIVEGNYALTAAPVYNANEAYAIEVSGGWSASCGPPSGGTTTLNGQNQVRTLALIQNSYALAAAITVRDLTLAAGFTTGSTATTVHGGALYVFDREAAVVIERNLIIGSRADQYGGGLYVFSSGPLLVRNNLLFANSALVGGAWVGTTDPNLYVTGNTLVANIAPQNTDTGGLYVQAGMGNAWLSNNIVWNNNSNGARDLYVTGSHVRLHNDIGTAAGTAPDSLSQGNLSVDPQFAPCSGFFCFNFHLGGSSPLIDAGYNGPPGGIDYYDLDHATRKIGPNVDIGAYELDRIFADGFE